jgi:hypothetical protein
MKLAEMTVDELVSDFEQHCIEQYKADLDFNMRRYNRAFDAMMAVSKELRGRLGDQRRALVSLHSHPNEQVRLKAAIHTLALFPADARTVMQKLIDDRIYPQAGDAGMLLDSLDEGRYVPE